MKHCTPIAWFLASVLVLGSNAANAATVYVYSTVGRAMTVVWGAGANTGSNVTRRPQAVPIKSDDIDNALVRAVIEKYEPQVTAKPLAAFFPAGGRPLDQDAIADGIKALAADGRLLKDDRVLVIEPERLPIRVDDAAEFGSTAGSASGLGVFVDDVVDYTQPTSSPGRSHGSLAFFANMRLVVVDPVSGKELGETDSNTGSLRSGNDAPQGVVWNAVPNAEKLQILQQVAKDGAVAALPKLPTKS
ncbi:MAG: hypothetical protein JSR18_05710 [Proteobacteria bacterium]|nr:hypothetical protein [Pseudomonadota bacterium]